MKVLKTIELDKTAKLSVDIGSIDFKTKLNFFSQKIMPLLSEENISLLMNLEVGEGKKEDLLKAGMTLLSKIGADGILEDASEMVLVNNITLKSAVGEVTINCLEEVPFEVEPYVIQIIQESLLLNFKPLFERFFSEKKK